MAFEWKTDNYKFVGKAFDLAFANRMNKLSPIIGEVNANSIDYLLQGISGYGLATAYDGSSLASNMAAKRRGFNTVLTPQEYALVVDIGLKEAKIDKLGETKRVGTRLGDSMAMTVYAKCLDMFANAFTSTVHGGDGVSWANAAHPIASDGTATATGGQINRGSKAVTGSGSTYSNLITSELSVSAITEACAIANRYVTPDGMPFFADYDTVLVSPELEGVAKKLFGETARIMPTQDPSGDTNAANPIYGMKYIVIGGGSRGFTAKQWAVCDSRMMKEVVNLVYNTRPTVMNSEQDNPLIDRYTGYCDFAVGWGDARQIIFSNPT